MGKFFRLSRSHFLALTGLCFFLFAFGNGLYTLFDSSETHYATVAREMVRAGNWLTLTFNGSPWFVHPPFYFWWTGPAKHCFSNGFQGFPNNRKIPHAAQRTHLK